MLARVEALPSFPNADLVRWSKLLPQLDHMCFKVKPATVIFNCSNQSMSGRSPSALQASYIQFSTGHDDLVHDVAYGIYVTLNINEFSHCSPTNSSVTSDGVSLLDY